MRDTLFDKNVYNESNDKLLLHLLLLFSFKENLRGYSISSLIKQYFECAEFKNGFEKSKHFTAYLKLIPVMCSRFLICLF